MYAAHICTRINNETGIKWTKTLLCFDIPFALQTSKCICWYWFANCASQTLKCERRGSNRLHGNYNGKEIFIYTGFVVPLRQTKPTEPKPEQRKKKTKKPGNVIYRDFLFLYPR